MVFFVCFTLLVVKIMQNIEVLRSRRKCAHRSAILNFGRSTHDFLLLFTQVNHISNFRMMQSCTVTLQIETCVVVVNKSN